MNRIYCLAGLATALLATGCRGMEPSADSGVGEWDSGYFDVDAGTDSAAVSDQDGAPAGATYFAVSGQLAVAGGELVADGSSVIISVLDETGALPALCEVELLPQVVEAVPPPVDSQIWGLWTLQLPVDQASCGVGVFPSRFSLGLGRLDPLLGAALGEMGADPSATAVDHYGLYFQLDATTPVFVFGTATNGAQVIDGAVGDGVFVLQTLHVLPL